MNNITKTLVAILANTALVWGVCVEQPDANGLVILPVTWTSVPDRAFDYCAEIKKVVIPQGVKEIQYNAFYGSGLEVIEFEADSKLEYIGLYAFTSCVKLKKMVIPQGVTDILYGTFYGTGLEVIEFEVNSRLETIGQQAFDKCVKLKKVVIPQGVKEIGYCAFCGTSIVSIVIPQGVASFDANMVFKDTPCEDKTVFKPGNTVVNCEIITTTPSPTSMPTTAAPTTMVPTTAAPTTAGPTTAAPTTSAPTTMVPTTAAPTTAAPTTMAPTEVKDACVNLKKRKCKNKCVFSKRQRQCLPKKYSFEHNCAQYEGKTLCLEVKVCKFPDGKCVHRCDGKSAQRCRKHQFCNLDKVVNPCFGCHLVTACGPRR